MEKISDVIAEELIVFFFNFLKKLGSVVVGTKPFVRLIQRTLTHRGRSITNRQERKTETNTETTT